MSTLATPQQTGTAGKILASAKTKHVIWQQFLAP